MYVACSVTRVPDLEEWTARANLSDMLTEPVGSRYCPNLEFNWSSVLGVSKWHTFLSQVRIAMVGKYTGLSDSYLSVLKVKSFFFSGFCLFLVFTPIEMLFSDCRTIDTHCIVKKYKGSQDVLLTGHSRHAIAWFVFNSSEFSEKWKSWGFSRCLISAVLDLWYILWII